MKKSNVCIIGGGASGMAAAIYIKEKMPDLNVLLLEKKDVLGKKLSVTGNGRCNISNVQCPTFGDTSRFFKSIGVEIKTDNEGRAYPVSERAKDVTETMENLLLSLGVDIKKNVTVNNISKINEKGCFIVSSDKESFEAEKVIIATGGKSAPQFGTTGDGYVLARNMGHTINKLAPALVALECSNSVLGINKGVRANAGVTLFRHSYFVEEEKGEVQFTEDGLSGICIFNLSNFVRLNENTGFSDYELALDLLPEYKPTEILYILSRKKNISGLKTISLMKSIVKPELARKLLKDISQRIPEAKDLSTEHLKDIILMFKNVRFTITGAKGWKQAQCTMGGVSWDDFNLHTMESTVVSGLYFTGEIIDYVGPCGGFNLENAWNTARKAGKAICTEYMR